MKIVDVRARTVAVPMEAPLRHSAAVHPGRCIRTILEIFTDEGLVGLGEWEDVVSGQRVGILKFLLLNKDPFNVIEWLRRQILFAGHVSLQGQGLERNRLYAAVETALLDLQAKVLGRPLYALLGGKLRDHIPMSAYLFWRYASQDGRWPAVSTPDEMVAHAQDLVNRYGFRTIKLKGGVFDPEVEVATVRALRERFGPRYELRLDPNCVWSTERAIRVGKQLEELDLEYLEDPTFGIEGMAEVARHVDIPLATNMCVVTFEQIPHAVRERAVNVILSDPWYWAGPLGVKHLSVICETFHLGLGMHSGLELGPGLALMLHTACTLPNLSHAVDAHYHHLLDDVIKGGKMQYVDGAFPVPEGPGLGVELDEDRMTEYEAYFQKHGGISFPLDPQRPEWYQRVPTW